MCLINLLFLNNNEQRVSVKENEQDDIFQCSNLLVAEVADLCTDDADVSKVNTKLTVTAC